MSPMACNCGCCSGIHHETPPRIFNRPGLSEIANRAGIYGKLRRSMLAGLTNLSRPALAGLKTRDDDDFSIALIDAWAVTGDVLSFYIERTANEHYLGTATERGSVSDIVQLIGYRLKPGVAAETHFAFGLETAPGAAASSAKLPPPGVPARVPIPKGMPVQSLPGPGELPQTFETVEDLDGLTSWNRLTVRTTRQRTPIEGDTSVLLAGTALNLNPGDVLLLVADDKTRYDLTRVTEIKLDSQAGRTTVSWSPPLTSSDMAHPFVAGDNVSVYVMRRRAALFGFNAPDPHLFSTDVITALGNAVTDHEWSFDAIGQTASLDTIYQSLQPHSLAVFSAPGVSDLLTSIDQISEVSMSKYAISAKVTSLSVSDDLGNFGTGHTRLTSILLGSELLPLAEAPIDDPVSGQQIEVVDDLDQIDAPRTILVRGRAARVQLADPGRRLHRRGGPPTSPRDIDLLTVLSIETEPAGFPGMYRWRLRLPDGTEAIHIGDPQTSLRYVPPGPDDPIVGEVATVKSVAAAEGGKQLVLAVPLTNSYDRHAVNGRGLEVFGNVVRGTHGETVREVLGSGDASKPNQRFTLRRAPLTYTQSANPQGGDSTLQVWVNDVLWHEAPSLFGLGRRDRRYVTRITDDLKTVVQGGDGETGARFAAGHENVRATYRVGSGTAGLLAPDQLSLLMTKPLGVKSVTNPLAPAGGQDAQRAQDARVNAPLSVKTLDRIVSLTDYEDFARNFSGIAKASVVWTWDGSRRGALITVAGVNGATITDVGKLHTDLVAAIANAGNARVPFVVRSYRPEQFRLRASLILDPDQDRTKVLRAVKAALTSAFSFDARAFGQLVALSEVIEVIQSQTGVVAVDVTRLHLAGDNAVRNPYVPAESPRPGGSPTQAGAQLLTLDPASLDDLEVQS
jgi:hypothetical protein